MSSRSITSRSTLAVATAAVAVIIALTGCSAGGASGAVSGGSSADSSADETPTAPGLNVPVTVGAFEFTALAAADAGTSVGTAPLTQTAQGTFFQLDLKIMNVGDAPETFIVNYLKLEDADGKTYNADASASLYAGGDAQAWIAAINPGNAVQGPILFDLPAGAKPVKLIVSDSMFNDGTAITLD
ncbi:DUF4352 domain-containing protein [Glaciibacter psychrotolerans]|uniref:DUF4352 domain-containing protein n=1 Tax=Glaciibacter psychrotolerans TaxID=670054 RepID=A0A7Z0EC91_9MICO|nr:DUF4352 domain-containing protein [Leifsonia psychrotolerans]NYJ18954.1 hypothetical protein [Leifsonia psychrotolerans]